MGTAAELAGADPAELATRLALPPHIVPIEPIHESMTAAVWHGRDRRVGVDIVLKVLVAEHGDRLEAETRAMGRVGTHPNVLAASMVGRGADGTGWMVAEEMEGTLGKLSASSSRSEVMAWASQLADALEFLHRSGVIHGDITPANVLVDSAGQARLADFGAARLEGDSTSGAPGGHTPRYAAPERRRGASATRASDIHGYGATVLAVLADGSSDAPWRARRLLRLCVRTDPARRPDAETVAHVDVAQIACGRWQTR